MELSGKIAIVSGGSRGIGRAIAQALSDAGAQVVVGCHQQLDSAQAFAETLTAGSLACASDLRTPEGCEALVRAAQELGDVDILVNNAGVTDDALSLMMQDEQWDRVMETNAGSCFRISRSILQGMARRRAGSVINISSVSAIRGRQGQANYAASKAAILAMTRSMALEVGKRGVRVNAVVPGFIETDMTGALSSRVIEEARKMIPMKRFGQPEDIAEMVCFLAGPRASYITGQSFVVDGGMSC